MNPDVVLPYHGHNWPAIVALAVGLMLLVLVYKAGSRATRGVLFCVACGFLAGAYWWYTHIRS